MIVIRFSYLDIYNIGIPASEFFIYGLRSFPFLARKGLFVFGCRIVFQGTWHDLAFGRPPPPFFIF